jgi:DNA-binding Xre family transcriptional regulator
MKKGFFIVEFLVYLVLFTSIMFLLMQLVVSKSSALKLLQDNGNKKIELLATLDSIARILEHAPGELLAYKVNEPDQLIWHCKKDSKDKGFAVQKNVLYFMQGAYNEEYGNWKHKRQTRLMNDLEEISFSLKRKELCNKEWVQLITVALKDAGNSVEKSVALYNRAIA